MWDGVGQGCLYRHINYVQLAHSNHCCTVTCSCGWCNELYHCTHTENTYNCRRRLPLTTLCAALHKSYVNLSINPSNYKHVWPECLYFVPLSYLCTSDASLLSLLRMYVHPQMPFYNYRQPIPNFQQALKFAIPDINFNNTYVLVHLKYRQLYKDYKLCITKYSVH